MEIELSERVSPSPITLDKHADGEWKALEARLKVKFAVATHCLVSIVPIDLENFLGWLLKVNFMMYGWENIIHF